jgi:3-methylcrotonyl-CoA carboxylase alpha subunit
VIRTLLVANRGEIACRIFRTARRLAIGTVAVFSDADATARHTRLADRAVRIGPAAARDSYLDIDRIIAAARASGAEAIHPGYGFLAENPAFAQACSDAGLTFVGPPAAAIRAMGSKILAKTRLAAAGVPMLPGYAGEQQDLGHLERAARAAGLPLIIKPAAGGGGKGMQIVREERELPAALAAARRLAASAFGDGALLLERYLPAPRHVEVQVFADTHGHCLHLGDRDCSIQRRHQKLIEEAPAPELPQAVRARLRAAAVVVAREIGYVGAGTVEFLFDGAEFYFMEMNTRLQVEHTVTEAVTGIDLVEWQLRVASGECLPLAQEQVRCDGHAIEARVCAEDPQRSFLPSAGRLALMQWPALDAVRVDAGFGSGDAVPDSYDSLLGKIIAWAPSRAEAAARLAAALEATCCAGVASNERWLARVLRSDAFLAVRHHIAFIDECAASFAAPATVEPGTLILAALALQGVAGVRPAAAASPWAQCDGFTPNLPALVTYSLSRRGTLHEIELTCRHGRPVSASVDGRESVAVADAEIAPAVTGAEMPGEEGAPGRCAARLDDLRWQARWLADGDRLHLWQQRAHDEFVIEDPRTREFSAAAVAGGLTTPLPGVVVAVPVTVGQRVAAGDTLMVIEAMKMEHTITAPYAGSVAALHFARGDRVPEGSQLLELTRAADD